MPPPPGAYPGYPAPPGAYPGYPAPTGAYPVQYPGAYGQPGAYPGPYGPPKKSRVGLWVGLGIGALVLLLCLCCVGSIGLPAYFGIQDLQDERQESVAAVTEYLGHLRSENYDEAYDLLCEESRVGFGRRQFADQAASEPLSSFDVGEAVESDDDWGYDVDADLTFVAGDTRTDTFFVYSLDYEDYRVCLPGD